MMKKEKWDNTAGFIRHKLFGIEPDKTLKRKVSEGCVEEIEILLKNRFEEFNRNLVYSTLKCERQVEAFTNETKVMDSKTVVKWASLLREYYLRIHSESEMMIELYCDLVRALAGVSIDKLPILQGKDRDTFLRCIPQDILNVYVKENKQGLTSPLMMEYAWRIDESKAHL